jgi:hypothetical protein
MKVTILLPAGTIKKVSFREDLSEFYSNRLLRNFVSHYFILEERRHQQ